MNERFLCNIAFFDPSGAELEEIIKRRVTQRRIKISLQLLLVVNNLLNELLVPGAHLNVSIGVLSALCIFLFAYHRLYDDDICDKMGNNRVIRVGCFMGGSLRVIRFEEG